MTDTPQDIPGGSSIAPTPKLGRRPGESITRDHILDVAELEFAQSGLAGASIRRLAERAEVSQALIVYYFGSKDALFDAVYCRRVNVLSRERQERLRQLEERADPPMTVEEVVRAYVAPIFDMMRGSPGGRAFMMIQSRVQAEPTTPRTESLRRLYDETARSYAAALRRLLPGTPAEDVYWRMSFSVGALIYNASGTTRLDRWSQGVCDTADLDLMRDQLVDFLSAGMKG